MGTILNEKFCKKIAKCIIEIISYMIQRQNVTSLYYDNGKKISTKKSNMTSPIKKHPYITILTNAI